MRLAFLALLMVEATASISSCTERSFWCRLACASNSGATLLPLGSSTAAPGSSSRFGSVWTCERIFFSMSSMLADVTPRLCSRRWSSSSSSMASAGDERHKALAGERVARGKVAAL
uniref:Secreted protein n=1 Tax=Zea mays TaxID=4577 RepID=C0P9Q5_MAIZE|nr:unknown [Zea mays]